MKKIISFVLFSQILFLPVGILSAVNQDIVIQKNTVITTVFSHNQQLKGLQKFPVFTQLAEYTKPRLFSLKKANKSQASWNI